MFDLNADEKPVGKCKKCGIDLYCKKDECKRIDCPICGPLRHKDINFYLYPQDNSGLFTQDK